jgi:hypothetical protein
MAQKRAPTEQQEQIALVRWLRARGVLHAHPPNGGRRSKIQGARLRAAGMSSGLPDLLIFDRPPSSPEHVGTALELKRSNGRESQVTENQRRWLDALGTRGWMPLVAFGAQDAIEQLTELGY